LEKETFFVKTNKETLITGSPLVMGTSQVVSILVRAGVKEVRIIKIGMKMPIQEFEDKFVNEDSVIKENRTDVAYRDDSHPDGIELWVLAKANELFKNSTYFQEYPLMSKTHGTFNVVFDGCFSKIYSSFSYRFRNKILGPNSLTPYKLSHGLHKTFQFCMDKTFNAYTRI
jgi:hypothetical protein